ncbi:MAG: serine hydrolase domain-containing protein [Candidatus Aminicenantes bacterium]|jgi:CubicO group peptidase (beta-lactamase class C family)
MNSMKFRIKCAFLLAIIIVFLGSLAQADSLTDQVDELFKTWDKPDSPGCALGVIKDGQFIYRRGYGMANLEYNIPLNSRSVFRIGSTSKQFTAMCIALLEEQGKISVDDSLRKYFPEMPEYANDIKIRHLLHHTSGIRDYLTLWRIAGERNDDFFIDPEVVALIARQKELNFNPGDEFLYSNSGYFLLSEIVKSVTGKSMGVFAEEYIFKPLGMKNTHFHDDHTMIVKNRASGYSPLRGGGFRISMTTLGMIGDGGVFTCVDDLLLWDRNFYNNRLGKGGQELIDRILTPGKLNNGEGLDYAYGLGIGDYKGLRMISHGGAFVGFRADMIRFPEQKFSVICLANLSRINPSQLARKVADVYLAGQFKEDKTEKKPTPKPRFIKLSEAELKEKTGAFRNPQTGTIWRISLRKETLEVYTFLYRFSISPVSQRKFLSIDAPMELEIEFEKKAKKEPMIIRVKREGRDPYMMEPVVLVSPTAEELEELVGEYTSEELQVTYGLELKEGKLFLVHENRYKDYPDSPLEPTLRDNFMISGMQVQFFRNEQNNVESFTVNAGRVKNIRFVRKNK